VVNPLAVVEGAWAAGVRAAAAVTVIDVGAVEPWLVGVHGDGAGAVILGCTGTALADLDTCADGGVATVALMGVDRVAMGSAAFTAAVAV
jgi:hypothetical protein